MIKVDICAIAAVTENWGIGKENKLLLSIPEDMKFFREATRGAAVIMGRKTLQSFPGGNPLKGRCNIVLTRDPCFKKDGVTAVSSVEDAVLAAENSGRDKIFVIGGGSVYSQFMPICKTAYITKIEANLPADSFFPDLDSDPCWEISHKSSRYDFGGIGFSFLTYENKNMKE